jgi:hypothetical protein
MYKQNSRMGLPCATAEIVLQKLNILNQNKFD